MYWSVGTSGPAALSSNLYEGDCAVSHEEDLHCDATGSFSSWLHNFTQGRHTIKYKVIWGRAQWDKIKEHTMAMKIDIWNGEIYQLTLLTMALDPFV